MKRGIFYSEKFNTYRTEFYVTGHGEFPVDMLRYDQAYPHSSQDAMAMGINTSDLGEILETRTIRMVSLNSAGPTVDRWRSFGWLCSTERPVFAKIAE